MVHKSSVLCVGAHILSVLCGCCHDGTAIKAE